MSDPIKFPSIRRIAALSVTLLISISLFISPALSVGEALPELDWYGYVGDNNDDGAYNAAATSDGGLIAVGHTQTDGELLPGHEAFFEDMDTYLVRTDAEGQVLWKKNYGRMLNVDYGVDVDALKDGGYIVVGNNESKQNGLNVIIIRTDSAGKITWDVEAGNAGDDSAVAVREMPDGSIMVLGQEDSVGVHSPNATLAHLIKFSPKGEFVSDHEYKGVTAGSMVVMSDGGVVVAGTKSKQVYVFKADKDGNLISDKFYSPESGTSEAGYDVDMMSDGGFIISGGQTSGETEKAFVIKTDANLKEQWRKVYAKSTGYISMSGRGKAVTATPDGGFGLLVHRYVGGMYAIPHTQVIKADASGNIVWTKDLPEDFGRDGESDIVTLSDGALAVAGTERYLSNPQYPYDQNVFVADMGKPAATGGFLDTGSSTDIGEGSSAVSTLLTLICGVGICYIGLIIVVIAVIAYVLTKKRS